MSGYDKWLEGPNTKKERPVTNCHSCGEVLYEGVDALAHEADLGEYRYFCTRECLVRDIKENLEAWMPEILECMEECRYIETDTLEYKEED